MANNDSIKYGELTRRDFVKYSAGTVASVYLTTLNIGCSNSNSTSPQVVQWPISDIVYATAENRILPVPVSANAPQINPKDLALYTQYNYSSHTVGHGLPCTEWDTIAPGYNKSPNAAHQLSFFTITDIHIADKESPVHQRPRQPGTACPFPEGLRPGGSPHRGGPKWLSCLSVD